MRKLATTTQIDLPSMRLRLKDLRMLVEQISTLSAKDVAIKSSSYAYDGVDELVQAEGGDGVVLRSLVISGDVYVHFGKRSAWISASSSDERVHVMAHGIAQRLRECRHWAYIIRGKVFFITTMLTASSAFAIGSGVAKIQIPVWLSVAGVASSFGLLAHILIDAFVPYSSILLFDDSKSPSLFSKYGSDIVKGLFGAIFGVIGTLISKGVLWGACP